LIIEQRQVRKFKNSREKTRINQFLVIETPVEPDTTTNPQEERFDSVNYVIDDYDDEPQVLQIHETSSTVTGNNGSLPAEEQSKGESQNTEPKQSEEYNEATVRDI
jgi:hypothetical protein